jgi:PIN domain nuclease of toxin-antitoxin system
MAKVFDSSAVLAFLHKEPGWERTLSNLPDGWISAVNAAEVLAVLVRNGMPPEEACLALRKTRLKVVDFSLDSAAKTAELLHRGISLGDRACMATALLMGLPVVTADRNWAGLRVPNLLIEHIRP